MQKLLHDVLSQGSDNLWGSNNYDVFFPTKCNEKYSSYFISLMKTNAYSHLTILPLHVYKFCKCKLSQNLKTKTRFTDDSSATMITPIFMLVNSKKVMLYTLN